MQIANAWATQFIAHINRVYGEIPPETIEAVAAEQTRAKTQFDQAQQALQAFIGESNVASLQREIEGLSAVLAARQEANAARLTAVAGASDATATGLINAGNEGRIHHFAQLYGRRNAALAQLDQATQLAAQLELGGDAAAASLPRPFDGGACGRPAALAAALATGAQAKPAGLFSKAFFRSGISGLSAIPEV